MKDQVILIGKLHFLLRFHTNIMFGLIFGELGESCFGLLVEFGFFHLHIGYGEEYEEMRKAREKK